MENAPRFSENAGDQKIETPDRSKGGLAGAVISGEIDGACIPVARDGRDDDDDWRIAFVLDRLCIG